MCLDYKTRKGQIHPKIFIFDGELVAFKVFRFINKKLHFPFYDNKEGIDIDKWIVDNECGLIVGRKPYINCEKSTGKYPYGFHSFTEQEGADSLNCSLPNKTKVIPILVREIVAKGWQNVKGWKDLDSVIVSKHIFIPTPKMRKEILNEYNRNRS